MDTKKLRNELFHIIAFHGYHLDLSDSTSLAFVAREVEHMLCSKYTVEDDLEVTYSVSDKNSIPTFGNNNSSNSKSSIFIYGTIDHEYHSIKIDIGG